MTNPVSRFLLTAMAALLTACASPQIDPREVVNGALSNDAEIKRAAALIDDAYTLFLLGPF